TIEQVKHLHAVVGRENLFVKIPATEAGLPAITAAIGEGISVNVTLIFSVERYQDVMEAYLAGLELADAAGRDLSKIHSVASFLSPAWTARSTRGWSRSAAKPSRCAVRPASPTPRPPSA